MTIYKVFNRKQLFDEVWSEPMTVVAKRYKKSSTGMKKICERLDIPTPPVGYWNKVKAGMKRKKPPLPKSSEVTRGLHIIPDQDYIKESTRIHWGSSLYYSRLEKEAMDWEKAMTIRDYVNAVEFLYQTKRIPNEQRKIIRKKIAWARQVADWLDPLVGAEDPDKKEEKRLSNIFFQNNYE